MQIAHQGGGTLTESLPGVNHFEFTPELPGESVLCVE